MRVCKRPKNATAIAARRQDLALHSLWIPLASAAYCSRHVQLHPAMNYIPGYELDCDNNGPRFMAKHTRLWSAPDVMEPSHGFPEDWRAVLRIRCQQLLAEQPKIDATAMLVMRLMCDMPIYVLDLAMCELTTSFILTSQCAVREAMRRTFYAMEHVLLMPVENPAYDAGQMALWMWNQRYGIHTTWEKAVFHHLGLPFVEQDGRLCLRHDIQPAQIWPRTNQPVMRSFRMPGFSAEDELERYGKKDSIKHVECDVLMVYYSIASWCVETGQLKTWNALRWLNKIWAIACRLALSERRDRIPQYALHVPAWHSYEPGAIKTRQHRLVQSMLAVSSVL